MHPLLYQICSLGTTAPFLHNPTNVATSVARLNRALLSLINRAMDQCLLPSAPQNVYANEFSIG